MDDEVAITIHEDQSVILPVPYHEISVVLSIEEAIIAWLDESFRLSRSEKTKQAYEKTLTDFRAYLQRNQLDLGSDYKAVAWLARQWVDTRSQSPFNRRKDRPISKNTYLQRLAIISSFYRFAVREDVLARNPIETIKRDRKGKKEPVRPLQEQEVKAGLAKIDRSTLEGMRDYALLLIALNTAHRAFELAGIRLGHLHFTGETCSITWERVKGDKQMDDSILLAKITQPLTSYLEAIYGEAFQNLPDDTPVWVSFSKQNKRQAIGTRTISNICKKYLGTSKVHTTRHTWAKWMMDQHTPLSQIGKGLGHSNLKTTSDYVEELAGYNNPLAEELASAFSLED